MSATIGTRTPVLAVGSLGVLAAALAFVLLNRVASSDA